MCVCASPSVWFGPRFCPAFSFSDRTRCYRRVCGVVGEWRRDPQKNMNILACLLPLLCPLAPFFVVGSRIASTCIHAPKIYYWVWGSLCLVVCRTRRYMHYEVFFCTCRVNTSTTTHKQVFCLWGEYASPRKSMEMSDWAGSWKYIDTSTRVGLDVHR